MGETVRVQPDPVTDLAVRDLGARGSRLAIGDADPAIWPSDRVRAVLALAPRWWAARATAAGLGGEWLDPHHALGIEPPLWLEETADVSAEGWTAHQLGQAYVGALSADVKARHGRHYTPDSLAFELWSMARKALGMRRPQANLMPGLIRDPACGAGSLLLPALREHLTAVLSRRAEPSMVLAGLPNLVEGVDTDPAAVWLANIILSAEALPVLAKVPSSRRAPLPCLVRLGDGLEPNPRPAIATVMNPPYGRVRLSPEERKRFAGTLYGHANLYGLFLAAAAENLEPESGVLAALVPTSHTSGLYFRNLRAELARTSPLREIAFVSQRDGVFTDVLQETCLAVFSRKSSRRTVVASVNGERSEVARVPTPKGLGPWLLPRHAIDAPTAAAAVKMTLTLGQAGWRASTGPLVWNRRRADLHSSSGLGRVPVVWAADLDGGALHQDEVRNKYRYFSLTLPSDPDVMVLDEPAILVQRTTAPEQRRRLVGVNVGSKELADWGGRVIVENHVNVVRPRTDERQAITHDLLARLLATATYDRIMRCMSGSVAVSAYELESLPLPSPETLDAWEQLPAELLEAHVAREFSPGPR